MSIDIPQTHRDLLESNQAVTLATLGADGYPQVTAVWFIVEEGVVKVSLNTARQKTKNLSARPEASLFFTDPQNPYRTLEIRANAELAPDPDYVLADRVGARYGGANLRERDQPGETRAAVTFHPVKVNTFG